MAKFLLFVTSSPEHSSAYSAYKFAQALCQSQHELLGIFFYGEGALIGNLLRTLPSDEPCLNQLWQTLQSENDLRLIICSAAAQRNGVLNKIEAEYHGHKQHNLSEHFEIAGLGEYVVLQTKADRIMQF